MSLRTRLTLAGGGAVFAALALASLVIFFDVRSNLRDQIDLSLIQTAQNIDTKMALDLHTRKPSKGLANRGNKQVPAGPVLGADASVDFQIIPNLASVRKQVGATGKANLTAPDDSSATTPKPTTVKALPAATSVKANSFAPLMPHDISVAEGLAPPYFRDVTYERVPLRLYTMRLSSSSDGLVRSARPVTEADATISRVRWLLITITLAGALAAALIGRIAAAAVLGPVRRLASVVEEVTTTRDLNQRIPVSGHDELSSLAGSFNGMLAALENSLLAQQQLIADASHELRTPLTAHRTNVELLARPDLPAERRPHVLNAAIRGIEELSTLVGDLLTAARTGKSLDTRTPVALDKLVQAAVERAQRRAPALRFKTRIDPYALIASPARLERAIDNVLDNAVKWSPEDAVVEVTLADGQLEIRDHGPGIDAADLPRVFDRFHRSAAARGLPGSGLGLAIVKQTVDDHGGTLNAANAAGGGTIVTLRFDARSPS